MAHVPRIFAPGRVAPGPLTLSGEQARRLAGVMRLRPGDEFRVFPGDGREWRAEITGVARDTVHAVVHEVARQAPPPELVIEVWLSVVRPQRFDWALEKCVEAGADIIRPLIGDHAARGDGGSAQRQDRWQRIVVEALEQCGRLHPVVVERPARFETLLGHSHVPLVIADGSGRPWTEVRPLLPDRGHIALAIGPEGGWSRDELAAARARGALFASLGPNILRTETAAVVATALLRAG